MQYKIEKGIPMPPERCGTKYPFMKMEIGDSIVIPDMKLQALQSLFAYYKKKHGRRFVWQAVEGGIRVWYAEEMPRDSHKSLS